jgi:CRISPR-associated protein Cas2
MEVEGVFLPSIDTEKGQAVHRRVNKPGAELREPKRLRRVHKVMKGFGEPWQYSVFFCVLRVIDRVRMQTALEAEMNLKLDKALILDLGENENASREAATVLGQPLPSVGSRTIVI